MRFATFRSSQGPRPALILSGGRVVDLGAGFYLARQRGAIAEIAGPSTLLDIISDSPAYLGACAAIQELAEAGELENACLAAEDAPLLAPIPRPLKNVFCVGLNYRAHITEGAVAQGKEDKVPEWPVYFTKPPTAVIGPDAEIRLDPAVSEKMDYEVELGVVIGRVGRDIKAADAHRHIFGFTILNDITARDVQRRHGGQFFKGKGLDTSCPMGPHIVTLDALPSYENLRISLTVNGETRQDGNTSQMIFPVAALIESLSEGLTLEPGDLIASGTPSGVGYAMDPPRFLKDGDVVTCEIEGIGRLSNTVRNVALRGD